MARRAGRKELILTIRLDKLMENLLTDLKNHLHEARDLEMAAWVLNWDQATYMPPGGAEARARQIATLWRLRQEKLIDPAVGRLLEQLRPYEDSLPYDSDEAGLIRITRLDYERLVKVPPEFTARYYNHRAETYEVWKAARAQNDFSHVQTHLEKTLDLSRELANFFPGYEHIADPLIDEYDRGMNARTVSELFSALREQLAPIVQVIGAKPQEDDRILHQHFPESGQLAFSAEVVRRLGYDFNRGRIDKTAHPFMIRFSLGDIRITTRVREDFLGENLFSTIHESGHGIYEQGINRAFEGTPLAEGTTSGVHESQSRLWENQVGRSRGFWKFFYPRLQEFFPAQLGQTGVDDFYRAINRVEPTPIRVDADEVTYNLHVMLRFDLELALLEGKLAVKDLPEAWNDRFHHDFGFYPPNDREGVLQDVHWFDGHIGGQFQGYTLGNLLAAQLFEAALQEHPQILGDIERGEFSRLLGWLRENIHRHGRKFSIQEVVQRVTGGPIQIGPFIRYLRNKYGELYDL
jgi:carboxypeptidase Taq